MVSVRSSVTGYWPSSTHNGNRRYSWPYLPCHQIMEGWSAIKASDWRLTWQGSYFGIIVLGFECQCEVIVLLSRVTSVMCIDRRCVLDSDTLIARVFRTRLELTSCLFLITAIVPFHRSVDLGRGLAGTVFKHLGSNHFLFYFPALSVFLYVFRISYLYSSRSPPSVFLFFMLPPASPVFCPSGFVF